MLKYLKALHNYYLVKVKYRKYAIGKGFYAGVGVRMWAKTRIEIGKNFYIGRGSFIESDVIVGDNVLWGNRVALVGKYDHHYQEVGMPIRLSSNIRDADYNWKGIRQITIIENDVWVGYGCTILSGVTIKEGSIVAASSLVTRDVEPYSIYAGIPARKIRDRFECKDDLLKHLLIVDSGYLKHFQSNS